MTEEAENEMPEEAREEMDAAQKAVFTEAVRLAEAQVSKGGEDGTARVMGTLLGLYEATLFVRAYMIHDGTGAEDVDGMLEDFRLSNEGSLRAHTKKFHIDTGH